MNSRDPNQTLRSSAFDLGLHCLPITLLGVSGLQWVKCTSPDSTNRRWTDKKHLIRSSPFASVSSPFLVRWVRSLYVDIRSCPFCSVDSFEHVQNLERTRTDNGIRWMYVSYSFRPLLVRFFFCTCPVLIRWSPIDPSRDRTSTGHVTEQTEVFQTYTANRTSKTDKERTETDL